MKTRAMLHSARVLTVPILLMLGAASAQSYDVLVSLTADDTLAGEAVRDEDLVRHAPGGSSHVQWPSETLALLSGDGGGTQALYLTPADIDAIDDNGAVPAGGGLYFSMPADQAGFKDGDVLSFGPAGLQVFRPEADFVAATGASDGNVDLDALEIDANGVMYFSFADNELSTVLSGDLPGQIKDGDVMSWVPSEAQAGMVYTEAQIDTLVSHALGVTVTTTDTSGLARDPVNGELLFSVLSPTANDATVFTVAGGGAIVPGHAEADFGFTGAPEIDALAVAVSSFPALTVSSGKPAAGAQLTFTLRAAQPGVPHVVLAALDTNPGLFPLGGWGSFALANDLLLGLTWSTASFYMTVPDGTGKGTLLTVVPPTMPPVDVVMQAVAPGAGAKASNPLVLELLQ